MSSRRLACAFTGILVTSALGWFSLAPQCGVALAFVERPPDHETHVKRSVTYDDLSRAVLGWLKSLGSFTPERFGGYIADLDRRTASREIDGEYDHLIFFLLQSERFTTHKRIEPALSAQGFVLSLTDAQRSSYLAEGSQYVPPVEKLPNQVQARIADFIRAVSQTAHDERLVYFDTLISRTGDARASLAEKLYVEYARTMRFLYQKEFGSRELSSPNESAAYIASLYRDRGHSTDTQVEANFALHLALSAIRAQTPEKRLNRVLIVGPGLDFAPRTDLMDFVGPQSYQPFAVADALLGLKLSDTAHLRIHCVDINDRVIAHLGGLSARKQVRLSLFSGVSDSAARPLTDEYKEYFREFGRNIGRESKLDAPGVLARHLQKALVIRPEIVQKISAERLNVITERYDPSPGYELVIVTNVFPYFNRTELLLALANVADMMTEGGYLIHNELQTVPGSFTSSAGLPLEQARTVLIAASKDAPLFDGVAIHRKVRP